MVTSVTPGDFQAADAAASAQSSSNKQSDDNTNAGTNNAAANEQININYDYKRMNGNDSGSALNDRYYPGATRKNPLNYFSSYNYQITLYLIAPDAYNSYIQTGLFPQQSKAVSIVVQSGGIDKNSETRAITKTGNIGRGQPGLDYFIDSFEFTTTFVTDSSAYGGITDGVLKIIEPYGFSFVTQLKKAVSENSGGNVDFMAGKEDGNVGAFKNLFIIGIKFYGYDVNGNLVTSKSDIVKDYTNGLNNSDGVIERYIPISITEVHFKIDGNSTVYTINVLDQGHSVTSGTINGYIQQTNSVTARTVSQALNGGPGTNEKGLMGVLNGFEEDKKDKKYTEIPVTYEVEFLNKNNEPDPDGPIASARLEYEVVPGNAPMSSATSTNKVTIKESALAATYDTVNKVLNFPQGIPIYDAIDNIITKSEYITQALNAVNNSEAETVTIGGVNKSKLDWYSINPIITVKKVDQKTNNWSYHIKYQIKPYTIYYIMSANVSRGQYSKYPGPYKIYNYTLTGENTEVMSFEMEFNNQWYAPINFSTSDNTISNSTTRSIPAPVIVQGGSQSDTGGIGINNSTVVAENVRAVLYTQNEQSDLKFKIMGDPDLISARFGVDQRTVAGRELTSVNIWGAQVLIEIFFNTASDYQDDGLLDVTDQIRFYSTSAPRRNGIKGLVCRIVSIATTFSRGSFTHIITATVVPEGELITDVSQQDADNNVREAEKNNNSRDPNSREPVDTSPGGFIDADRKIPDSYAGDFSGDFIAADQAYANDDQVTNSRSKNGQSTQNNSQQNGRVDRFGILRPGSLIRRTNTQR